MHTFLFLYCNFISPSYIFFCLVHFLFHITSSGNSIFCYQFFKLRLQYIAEVLIRIGQLEYVRECRDIESLKIRAFLWLMIRFYNFYKIFRIVIQYKTIIHASFINWTSSSATKAPWTPESDIFTINIPRPISSSHFAIRSLDQTSKSYNSIGLEKMIDYLY